MYAFGVKIQIFNLNIFRRHQWGLRTVRNFVECLEIYKLNHSLNSSTYDYYSIEATDLRKSQLYYKVYFMAINTIFGHVLPFAIIFTFNILVVRILRNVQNQQQSFVSQPLDRLAYHITVSDTLNQQICFLFQSFVTF